jgi:hypothetical protein
MTDDEKEAAKRRYYAPLVALLHATEYKLALSKIALEIGEGKFDALDIYNRLLDAEKKIRLDLNDDRDRILKTLWRETTVAPTTDHNFDVWQRHMQMKRTHNKRLES